MKNLKYDIRIAFNNMPFQYLLIYQKCNVNITLT